MARGMSLFRIFECHSKNLIRALNITEKADPAMAPDLLLSSQFVGKSANSPDYSLELRY
jgi:hypothetical protein